MKTVVLAPEEDKKWEEIFSFHINDGKTDEEADRLTFDELKSIYPRLKNYSKIK